MEWKNKLVMKKPKDIKINIDDKASIMPFVMKIHHQVMIIPLSILTTIYMSMLKFLLKSLIVSILCQGNADKAMDEEDIRATHMVLSQHP